MLGIVSTAASPLQPPLVSEASHNQEIISLLLFIPALISSPLLAQCKGPHPQSCDCSQAPFVTSQETSSSRRHRAEKRDRAGRRHRAQDPGSMMLLHSPQIPGERHIREDWAPRQLYSPLHFVLGAGLWSIKGGWHSDPCSASLQSNCLFPRRLS